MLRTDFYSGENEEPVKNSGKTYNVICFCLLRLMRTVGKQGWKQEEILQIKNEDGLDKGDKNRCWEKGPRS